MDSAVHHCYGGVRDAIGNIKDELISMQSFLVDADKKGTSNEGEITWVANVRDMAYVIINQQTGGRSAKFLHQNIYFPKNLWVRHQATTKLQKISKAIKTIAEMNQRYGVNHIEGTSSKDNHKWIVCRGESSLFLKEDELVGIENKGQLIMVRMGGSGKTTLVANAYNNDDVKKHFDCFAWITVSQAYELEDLLRNLITEFYESRKQANLVDSSSMNYRLLVKTLVNYLEKKMYLPVLDDIWDTNVLDEIKVLLRDSFLGCRIILTTRKEDVACYHLGEEAWELFCKKAFSSSPNGSCPPELKSFAQELVGKCEGLLLAIAALGSLMYSKYRSQWNEIYNNLNWTKSILSLSFNELPYQEALFLIFLSFPEDQEFVEKVEGSTLEEVADSYLVELTFRNMLQVVQRNEYGRPKRCKLHDLLWELALSISLCSFLGFNKTLKTLPTGSKMLRVLDLEKNPIYEMPDEVFKLFNLRYLNLRGTLLKKLPNSIGRLLNLQTLGIKDTQIKALPRGIGKLQNLRHLIIYFTGMQIATNIISLKNLQSIGIVEANGDFIRQVQNMLILTGKLEKVPQWFRSLQSLTHLYPRWLRLEEELLTRVAALPHLGRLVLSNAYVGKQLCFRTDFPKLTKLEIHNSPQLNEIIIEMGVMPNMKSLYITCCMELKTVPKGIEYLKNLQQLYLEPVSMELQNSIEGEGSVDFPKVQHIPNIIIR
ncbi:hypothetical protein ACB098_12G007900 [Castanea mollissima]